VICFSRRGDSTSDESATGCLAGICVRVAGIVLDAISEQEQYPHGFFSTCSLGCVLASRCHIPRTVSRQLSSCLHYPGHPGSVSRSDDERFSPQSHERHRGWCCTQRLGEFPGRTGDLEKDGRRTSKDPPLPCGRMDRGRIRLPSLARQRFLSLRVMDLGKGAARRQR